MAIAIAERRHAFFAGDWAVVAFVLQQMVAAAFDACSGSSSLSVAHSTYDESAIHQDGLPRHVVGRRAAGPSHGISDLKATLNKYRRRHQPCLFAGHRAVGEGRLAVCRDDGPKACGQTGLAPTD